MTVLAQSSQPLVDLAWIGENLDVLWEATLEHVWLTAVSVAAGLVLSLVLSAVALRWRNLYAPIASAAGILYTIPSLAAFALLWPLLGGVRNKGLIAIVALTSYTILILVRNIVTGIDGVPDGIVEAADGMGYRPVRRFTRIELPLALPAIVAGLRVATVTVVGLVTVTALIGLGGLGALILDGFRRGPLPTMILTGVVASVVLATLLDGALVAVERWLTPWTRRA